MNYLYFYILKNNNYINKLCYLLNIKKKTVLNEAINYIISEFLQLQFEFQYSLIVALSKPEFKSESFIFLHD